MEATVSYMLLQFKGKDSEKKPYPLCLGNISKDFATNIMKKTGLKGSLQIFSVDYNAIFRYPEISNEINVI